MFDAFALAQHCAASVHPQTIVQLMRAESSLNPFAIGVVGAHLERQPRTLAEALATAQWLDTNGYNFSVGLMQVNKKNLNHYGLSINRAFDACPNVAAGASILKDCYERARVHHSSHNESQLALRDAFSCYYSGNFKTGYTSGYVLRVVTGQGHVKTKSKDGKQRMESRSNYYLVDSDKKSAVIF